MKTLIDIEPFRSLLERDQNMGYLERYGAEHPAIRQDTCTTSVKMGRKYANVDIGKTNRGGRYMVDLETGEIFGCKAYGVIHRGHCFGNLDTINEWNWSDYRAVRIVRTFQQPAIA
jgi:hypothetical protein